MLPWQNWRSLQCHPAYTVDSVVNKQVKGKILPRELIYILSTLNTLRAWMASWNMWRKMIRKRRKPKKKVPGFNWSPRVLHTERHSLWEWVGRSLSCWNPFLMNSWHDKYKKIKDLYTVKKERGGEREEGMKWRREGGREGGREEGRKEESWVLY